MPADLLNNIRVASPCSASWEEMQGDERVRFCALCSKNVYNLSAMTDREVEALVREKEGRLCGWFYRRRDGTILTADCPRGKFAMRRGLITSVASLAALFAVVPSVTGLLTRSRWREWPLWQKEPYRSWAIQMGIMEAPRQLTVINPPPPMGVIAIAPPPPTPTRGRR